MNMDKLTSKFQMALAEAQSLAVGLDHQFIEPAHVMVAMLDQQGGSIRGLLMKSGVNVNLLRSQLGDALEEGKQQLQQSWENAALRTKLKTLEYTLKMQRKRMVLLMEQVQLQAQAA